MRWGEEKRGGDGEIGRDRETETQRVRQRQKQGEKEREKKTQFFIQTVLSFWVSLG